MAVTYSTAAKTNRMQAVLDLVNAGSGAGKLKYRDASNVVLVTFTLTDPAGTVSGDVLTFDCDPDLSANAGATGTVANAIITDSDDTIVVSGLTVGTSGTNVIVSNTSIASGQPCTFESCTITHAA